MENIQFISPSTPIIITVISLLFLMLSIYYIRPWLTGAIGSTRIQREINLLQKKGATVMNHIQLPTKKGDIIHIDHLVITNTQIIAISTLGYSGDISGSIRSATWIQETSQGQHRFPNPVKQHEILKQTIQSTLGDRLKIRTISAFTTGRLHGTDSKDVIPATECAKTIHAELEDITSGSKQHWATNIIRNIALEDADSRAEKERVFIARQGNEKRLKTARYMMGTSASLMLVAIILAGVRLASNHALIA